MFGVVLAKLGVVQNPDVTVAVTVKDAWAQSLTLCKKLLRDQHKVVALQTNQQLNV